MLAIRRVRPSAATEPDAYADERHPGSLAQNQAQYVTPLCAQGHANADFMGPLSTSANHAVDPHRGKKQGQSGEGPEQELENR